MIGLNPLIGLRPRFILRSEPEGRPRLSKQSWLIQADRLQE